MKKSRNQEVIKYTDKHFTPKSQERIRECGDWIDFFANREVSKLKVCQANFCEKRFCPMCAWRKAKKDALRIAVLMKYIEQEHKKAFVSVTLTAPNVKAEGLKDEITRYNKAFKKMMERKVFKTINKGYIRKLEITYNAERNDYHPHFHVVITVNPSYFANRTYIKQETWLKEWQAVMSDTSISQVYVKRFDSNTSEIAKYAAKDSDYARSQEVFDAFYKALKGRQVLTYNGLFAEANKKYKAKELEHYKDVDDTEYCYRLLYRWGMGEYVEAERRELTDKERREVNKVLIDEVEIDD